MSNRIQRIEIDETGEPTVYNNLIHWEQSICIAAFKGVLFVDENDKRRWTIVVLSVENALTDQGWNMQVKFNMQDNPDQLSAEEIVKTKMIADLLNRDFIANYNKIGTIIEKQMIAIQKVENANTENSTPS